MSEIIPNAADITPARRPAPASAAPGMGAAFERVRAFADQPAVAKSLPMLGIAALLGFALLLWFALSSPPQRELFAGLPDADKASVAQALQAAGIDYDLNSGTGALSVSEKDFYQAKMLLASQGLPKSTPDGDAMISSLPLGASRAVEGERLRGARELDLARTIEAIDAVGTARVHLAVEAPSAFVRDRANAAASVMLQLKPGRTLADAQVNAITHLVASSVPGLSPDDVSIVDQTGRLLSRSNGPLGAGASDRHLELQGQVEGRYLDSLNKLLTSLVGAGNFTAEVHADLDFSEVQATRESYPKELAVVREERGGWTRDGQDGQGLGGGVPGALSNEPPAAATTSTTPPPGQQTAGGAAVGTGPVTDPNSPEAKGRVSETYNRTFELGREVSVTRQPMGEVKRLSVAVALRQDDAKKLSKAEIASIEQLVKGAVGYDVRRGDVVAIDARGFAAVAEPEQKWWEASWVAPAARNITAVLVALIVVFGLARPLLARRAAAGQARAQTKTQERSVIGSEIAAAIASQAKADPERPVTLDMIEAAPGYAARATLIRNFVRQDPARAALVVRDLIRSDLGGGSEQHG